MERHLSSFDIRQSCWKPLQDVFDQKTRKTTEVCWIQICSDILSSSAGFHKLATNNILIQFDSFDWKRVLASISKHCVVIFPNVWLWKSSYRLSEVKSLSISKAPLFSPVKVLTVCSYVMSSQSDFPLFPLPVSASFSPVSPQPWAQSQL